MKTKKKSQRPLKNKFSLPVIFLILAKKLKSIMLFKILLGFTDNFTS